MSTGAADVDTADPIDPAYLDDLRALHVRVFDNACGCGIINRGWYCQGCGDDAPCEVERLLTEIDRLRGVVTEVGRVRDRLIGKRNRIRARAATQRARIVAAQLAFASKHPKWTAVSTHYEGCWQAHSECMATVLLDIAREA